MTLLIIGKNGQIASALRELCRARDIAHGTHSDHIALGRPDFDLTQQAQIPKALDDHAPTLVVNAAAYTAVDQAEDDASAARALNTAGPQWLAEATHARDIPLIHISTDYVFDGEKPTPYQETDPPVPLGVYGQTKYDGERAVLAANPNALVLRTAWVYSPFGKNFVKTMLTLAQTRDTIAVVDDQIGSPTSAHDIADAIVTIAELRQRAPTTNAPAGVFHLAGSGQASWADVAKTIFQISEKRGGPTARVKPIPSSEYPTPVRRPANSRLDCSKLSATFGVTLPHWHDSIEQVIARLLTP